VCISIKEKDLYYPLRGTVGGQEKKGERTILEPGERLGHVRKKIVNVGGFQGKSQKMLREGKHGSTWSCFAREKKQESMPNPSQKEPILC